MERDKLIKMIKEDFADHVATFKQLNEYTQEIEFKKPGTSFYYVRFVMSGTYLFVCGDIGDAVYQLSEQAKIEKIAKGYDLYYFTSKLRTVSGGKYTFDGEAAIERIKEDMQEYDEEELTDEIKEAYSELIKLTSECTSIEYWNYLLAINENIADKVDPDWTEWLPSAGDQLNSKLIRYWIALKLAAKQLGFTVDYID